MIDRKYKPFLFSFLLFLLCNQTGFAADIKVTLDRNPVSINESFQLTFTATESPDDDPDFAPLDTDFEILNQSKSSNSSWINGKSSKSILWTLNVMAKRPGSLIIPIIAFGDDRSQARSILVTKSTLPANSTNDELFLEVSVSSETPYVQSQILYTLRLFRRVQISQASLTEPEMTDAIIEKLTEDKNYNTEINGVAYVVTERKYAIFPQKSGVATIKPLTLSAQIVANSRTRFNGFFSRQNSRTKRVMSKAITVDVQPAPAKFTANRWIPSEQLYIEQKWSGNVANMKVGEPLTRTLTILAKGTTVAQLPELHHETDLKQIKTYPDQPVLKEQKNADGMIAFREEKIAYIPSTSGDVTLAAIEIPWFNTQTQTMETARIPEQTLSAIASAKAPATAEILPLPVQTSNSVTSSEPVIQTVENKLWMWIALFFAFAWLITLFFLLKKSSVKQPKPILDKKASTLKDSVNALKLACVDNNQSAAKDALLAWGKIKFNSTNLTEIAVRSEARLRDEIYLLNQTLYANSSEPWQGKKLFQTFTENNARDKVSNKIDDQLEPLYKS